MAEVSTKYFPPRDDTCNITSSCAIGQFLYAEYLRVKLVREIKYLSLTVCPVNLTHVRLRAALIDSPKHVSCLDHLDRVVLELDAGVH